MIKRTSISRRAFIKQCVSVSTGMSLLSILPFPLKTTHYLPPLIDKIQFAGQPYWLEVLSRGVSFFPEKAKIDIEGWSNDDLRGKAYYALSVAFEQNEDILSKKSRHTEKEKGIIIDNNKLGQFLLECTKGPYTFSKELTSITFYEDPIRARIFYDLSSILIHHIMIRVDASWFNGLIDFELKLLHSAETYLREAIQISKNAMKIFPDRFQGLLRSNIGTGYNNLGLALNLLGDIEEAYKMYQMALEWNPSDDNITRNLKALYENAVHRHPKPLWGDFFPSPENKALQQ